MQAHLPWWTSHYHRIYLRWQIASRPRKTVAIIGMATPLETIENQVSNSTIDKFFESDPGVLVKHQISSFNKFFEEGIAQVFRERNPINIVKLQDPTTKEYLKRCQLFLGGKDGKRIYFGKPVVFDDNESRILCPNEARLRNMTYGCTIHYDVEVDFYEHNEGEEAPDAPTTSTVIENVLLGKFPIMLLSNPCILKGMPAEMRFNLGECKNDNGGYFIIDGKEKCIVSQDVFGDNMLYTRSKVNDVYGCAADVRSVSEDSSKPVRTISVRMVLPSPKLQNGNIVVMVPNVRKPVPLFILMRALGVISDKEIIETCLLDMNKNASMVDLFIPSVYDAGEVFDQVSALKYISTLTKGKTVPGTLEILADYFLPHIGVMDFRSKAYFVGHMVFEMLGVARGGKPTNRDSFKYKRVEVAGTLLSSLFREYHSLETKAIFQWIDKEFYYKQANYADDFQSLITGNVKDIFGQRLIEAGFRKAFKGQWGSTPASHKDGIVQDLNRLSFNAAVSHLRKVVLPLDASAKVLGPRWLNSSQWGLIDPIDTPDGGNVGLHKHLALTAHITEGRSDEQIVNWIKANTAVRPLETSPPSMIRGACKVFVNGKWIGSIVDPSAVSKGAVIARRSGEIDPFTSVYWDITANCLQFMSGPGRLCRPVFYVSDGVPSYSQREEQIISGPTTWHRLTVGDSETGTQAVIDYLDTNEEEGALIAMDASELGKAPYTHLEIHPSLILGVMGNQVVFPENNQLPRDLFACGQMRQAVSLYHSNYLTRIDKMGVVLNYGNTPLVKSRYLEKICKEDHPYGQNVIVAIMCYGGYNVEDSILFNGGSVDRGLFGMTYYNSYEAREDSSTVGDSQVDSVFSTIDTSAVSGTKPGYDYSDLNKNGVIAVNTRVNDKSVIIGKVTENLETPETSIDSSVYAKKGQVGWVDKTYVSEDDLGFRLAKVRVRDVRKPSIGDKFCSRCGQKGTVGLVIPEEDMPFTDRGVRPDLIINPHALPSRMTIGQLVETLMGKACLIEGGFGDCTAFMNKGQKAELFGKVLVKHGYESKGNEILRDGQSGQQIEAEVFIGPTYYMRLKHMVKDKLNYRARGPRTSLTRQTVQGRANDGGLRVGEMERDGLAAHGAVAFLTESLLVRGDDYYMAVCNQTGLTAVYNESNDIFLSPVADGPIKFIKNLEGTLSIVNVSKYGRSFSVIRIPYALKLLIQELQGMNVQMRLVTEDNIDSLALMAGTTPSHTIGPEFVEKIKSEMERTSEPPLAPQEYGWMRIDEPASGIQEWRSLIRDAAGNHTDTSKTRPTGVPKGWASVFYPDGTPASVSRISAALHRDQGPDNWNRVKDGVSSQGRDETPMERLSRLPEPTYSGTKSYRMSDESDDDSDGLPNQAFVPHRRKEAETPDLGVDLEEPSPAERDGKDMSPSPLLSSTAVTGTTTTPKPPPPPRPSSAATSIPAKSKPPPPPRSSGTIKPPPPPRSSGTTKPPPPPRNSSVAAIDDSAPKPAPPPRSSSPVAVQNVAPKPDANPSANIEQDVKGNRSKPRLIIRESTAPAPKEESSYLFTISPRPTETSAADDADKARESPQGNLRTIKYDSEN